MYECEKQNKAIVAAIRYGMSMYDFSPEQIATAMRESCVTFFRRMKHPENFTLDELRRISGKLHTTVEKLINGETN